MEIKLTEIYKGLDEWRAERGITAESQKAGYLVNVMEELGELAQALRDYEKFSKTGLAYNLPEDLAYYDTVKKVAEHEIIDALCDISVFTINAGADIPCQLKPLTIETEKLIILSIEDIFVAIADFIRTDANGSPFNYYDFALILKLCASVCEQYGFDFQIAMDETIKEISSRTGSYDEKAKKWVKDTSDEAKSKWYKADYELARIKQC